MDKNTVIGILLIGAIIITFSIMNKPSKEELEKAERKRDSIEMVKQTEQLKEIVEKEKSITNEEVISEKKEETVDTSLLKNRYGAFGNASYGTNDFYTLENDLLKLVISSKGGRPYSVELKKFRTYDSLPLILFDGDSTIFGFEFFATNRNIFTNNLFFTPVNTEKSLYAKDNEKIMQFRLYAGNERYIEYTYTIKPSKYMVDFDVKLVNLEDIIAGNTTHIDLNWQMYSPQQEKGAENENNYTTIGFKYLDEEVDELRSRGKDAENKEINIKLEWIAFKQQFFSSILVAENNFSYSYLEFAKLEDSDDYLKLFTAEMGVPYNPGSTKEIPLGFYFGPNHYNTLKKYDKNFESLIPLGGSIIKWVNKFVIIPVFNFLNKYIESYGLIILLLTIFIKIIIFPLTYKSYT